MLQTTFLVIAILAGLVLALLLIGWLWNRSPAGSTARAQRTFERGRPLLERELLQRAALSGRPRGLRWKQCELNGDATFARDQASGQVLAFVGATVSFEAVAGGPMEDVEAVGNLRAGTAVFTLAGGKWLTDGRVLFNLDPVDALQRYEGRIERLENA
jgi:hypothetical protein